MARSGLAYLVRVEVGVRVRVRAGVGLGLELARSGLGYFFSKAAAILSAPCLSAQPRMRQTVLSAVPRPWKVREASE